jgi:glycosyltransferase involved in cell wall biosynthesis
MPKGLVSVIMPVYNAEGFIADSIRSILDQTYENWEFIIINDCSSDTSTQIIERFLDDDPRIKLIHNKENLGPAKASNIGLKHIKGEFIARLDADDVSVPSRLDRQVRFLNFHPDISLIGSGAYLIDNYGHKMHKINVISRDRIIRKLMTHVNLFIHSSIMARTSVIEDMGGYREKFRYSYDYDLFLRLANKYNLSNVSEYLIGWRTSVTSITLQHHTLQRTYADIARGFAVERKRKKYDSYDDMDFDELINEMRNKNYGRYLCDHGVYRALFMKQYKEGLVELLKGIGRRGIPYNALMRGIVHVIAKV